MSRPVRCGAALVALCARGGWGCSRGVLTRARAQGERRGRGAAWGGPWWPGWGVVVVACHVGE